MMFSERRNHLEMYTLRSISKTVIGIFNKHNIHYPFIFFASEYQRYPFVGIYKIFTPAVILVDLDVVKTVLSKDFANFGENTLGFSTESVLVKKNPFVLKLQEWKPVRQQLASLLSSSKVICKKNVLA